MYYHQNITTRLAIASIWAKAYSIGTLELDYTDEPNGMFKARQAYLALANYRRYIRNKRLNPLYSKEWKQISVCVMPTPKTPKVQIKLRTEFQNKRLLKNLLKRHPFSSLAIPTSVSNA
jgi:hypothetical protein